jgi:hypothetical protein
LKYFSVRTILFIFIVLLLRTTPCFGYSVLTHEAIIDASWNNMLVPLIRQRFPAATNEELKKAHAFAYGGSIAPDMGFYPFGSKLFTDLIHYVRSGDFIENLFEEASDINEYAFALGVFSHYCSDVYGHEIGVNRSVPLIYPKMKKQFGDTVTYADDRISHLQTEFSFDVLQTSKGNYASQSYHDFIGFEVSKELLEKAFRKTYGLEINDLFGNFERALKSFRWSVKHLIPFVTRITWKTKNNEIRKLNPTATRRNYIYRIRSASYYAGSEKDKISFGATIISFFIRIVPKLGPLKVLKFKVPTPATEKLFLQSFDTTILFYGSAAPVYNIQLPDLDFDTGNQTILGEYRLADETYCNWVLKLREKKFETTTNAIREDIFDFYNNNMDASALNDERRKQIITALQELQIKNNDE